MTAATLSVRLHPSLSRDRRLPMTSLSPSGIRPTSFSAERSPVGDQRPPSRLTIPFFDQVAQHLLDEQWVPFGLMFQRLSQSQRYLLPGTGFHHLLHFVKG